MFAGLCVDHIVDHHVLCDILEPSGIVGTIFTPEEFLRGVEEVLSSRPRGSSKDGVGRLVEINFSFYPCQRNR